VSRDEIARNVETLFRLVNETPLTVPQKIALRRAVAQAPCGQRGPKLKAVCKRGHRARRDPRSGYCLDCKVEYPKMPCRDCGHENWRHHDGFCWMKGEVCVCKRSAKRRTKA
jgi:hypothetical protein